MISTTSDDFGGYPGGDPYRANAPPPPPGFRTDFMGQNSGVPPRTGTGGFWTGAATGGLLGYMFGNRKYLKIL